MKGHAEFGSYERTLLVSALLLAQTGSVSAISPSQPAEKGSDTGLVIVDSPDDLTNKHPHLWCRGYGPQNGLWKKAQTTHAEIWKRLSWTAHTGEWKGIGRSNGQELMRTAMAFVISKDPRFGKYCQSAVVALIGHDFVSGGDQEGIGNMETFYGYCLAYDAIVDDPDTKWLTAEQKAAALRTMAVYVSALNLQAGATWRVRPTHNFMVLRAADHAAGLYNLRGEPAYEGLFKKSREFTLLYHNERVNGLGNAPLTSNGPRPTDGFPYEGPNYGAYQASRALIHRHILETNEYPNPPTVLDENKSGFFQNYNLAWMALVVPGASQWADVCHKGAHGMLQGVRYYSAINKANGNETMARVGEWFHNKILPGRIGGAADEGWWQGWEMVWYDQSIKPLSPGEVGLPLYIHLDDSEFHMYRDTWDIYPGTANDTYVYFRNSAHDGHNYWAEHHSGEGLSYETRVQTASHDGGDNGHFGVFRDNKWLASNRSPSGKSSTHNCLTIDGAEQTMKAANKRGYEVPELAGTDCIGAVDSDYGHALDANIGPAYPPGTVKHYHRYFFVIRKPMYVLVVDEVEPGHTIAFHCNADKETTRQADGLFTSPNTRYEVMYPRRGVTSTEASDPMVLTTKSPQLMLLVHPNPSGVEVAKSYAAGQMTATIGQDTVIYNPKGDQYSSDKISGDARLFAQRAGGVLIFQATNAKGSQYGVRCEAAANVSISGEQASIYVYGDGVHKVTVISPAGTKTFDIQAGRTIEQFLADRDSKIP